MQEFCQMCKNGQLWPELKLWRWTYATSPYSATQIQCSPHPPGDWFQDHYPSSPLHADSKMYGFPYLKWCTTPEMVYSASVDLTEIKYQISKIDGMLAGIVDGNCEYRRPTVFHLYSRLYFNQSMSHWLYSTSLYAPPGKENIFPFKSWHTINCKMKPHSIDKVYREEGHTELMKRSEHIMLMCLFPLVLSQTLKHILPYPHLFTLLFSN